jgi:hypothetical protein
MRGGLEEQILEKTFWHHGSYGRVDVSVYDQAFEARDSCGCSKRYCCLESSTGAHANINKWLIRTKNRNRLEHRDVGVELFKPVKRLGKVLRGIRIGVWLIDYFCPFF